MQGDGRLGLSVSIPRNVPITWGLGEDATSRVVEDFYEPIELVGRGAHSAVYRGRDKASNREVAVKVVSKEAIPSAAKLRDEVKILKSARHECILSLLDVFETPLHLYLVTEFARGGELFNRIEREGSFSERDACVIVRQLLRAVRYLHKRGIVHRDIKPENILLPDPDDPTRIKLSDFGIAKIFRNVPHASPSLFTPPATAVGNGDSHQHGVGPFPLPVPASMAASVPQAAGEVAAAASSVSPPAATRLPSTGAMTEESDDESDEDEDDGPWSRAAAAPMQRGDSLGSGRAMAHSSLPGLAPPSTRPGIQQQPILVEEGEAELRGGDVLAVPPLPHLHPSSAGAQGTWRRQGGRGTTSLREQSTLLSSIDAEAVASEEDEDEDEDEEDRGKSGTGRRHVHPPGDSGAAGSPWDAMGDVDGMLDLASLESTPNGSARPGDGDSWMRGATLVRLGSGPPGGTPSTLHSASRAAAPPQRTGASLVGVAVSNAARGAAGCAGEDAAAADAAGQAAYTSGFNPSRHHSGPVSMPGARRLRSYGSARELGSSDSLPSLVSPVNRARMRTYTACGTEYYLAPEMLRGTGYDERIDMWSLGVVTYILLCGYPPFESADGDLAEMYHAIQRGVTFPPEEWGAISASALEFVSALLSPDPEKRLSTRGALHHAWLKQLGHTGARVPLHVESRLRAFNASRRVQAMPPQR